jgi:penicillin-binding protein 2
MIEKYINKKITRKDLEKRMLEGSLQAEYNKYIAKPIVDTLINTTILKSLNTEMKKEEEIKVKDTTKN